jgi:hypothetical protein
MADADDTQARYRVSYRPANEDAALPAGIIVIGADNVVTVEQTEERFARMLTRVAKEVNGLSHFTIKTAPPPDAERYSLWGQSVERNAAEAGDVLHQLLTQRYGLTLEAA